MRHFLRISALVLTLAAGFSFGAADQAQARTSFSFSVGVPLGYHGGYYGGGYGFGYRGYHRGPHWGAHYQGYWPGYYRPYRYSYYVPRPTYYPRGYYRSHYRPYYGPIVTLGLFPAYVGDTLSYRDRGVYYDAYQRALAAPIGESIAWNSGAASGAVTTTRDGWAGEKYCREFRQDVTIDGTQEAYGTVCRQPNGDWQIVQNQ